MTTILERELFPITQMQQFSFKLKRFGGLSSHVKTKYAFLLEELRVCWELYVWMHSCMNELCRRNCTQVPTCSKRIEHVATDACIDELYTWNVLRNTVIFQHVQCAWNDEYKYINIYLLILLLLATYIDMNIYKYVCVYENHIYILNP